MNNSQAYITTDRECLSCGYNLNGLPAQGKCPECGSQIKAKSKRTSGKMAQEAPTQYVKALRIGFLSAFIGIILSAFQFFFPLGLIAGSLWAYGIWTITKPRPNLAELIPDKTLDSEQFRLITRILCFSWIAYSAFSYGIDYVTFLSNKAGNDPSSLIIVPLKVLSGFTNFVGWISLIPICVYIAELSYWASNDHIANRLRGCAWVMTVCGSLGAFFGLLSITNWSFSDPAWFTMIFMRVLVFFAILAFLFSIAQLIGVMSWLINNQKNAIGSEDRVRERIERDIKSPGTINYGLICRKCKYDLDGLPYGGRCPECGESYADFTPRTRIDYSQMYKDKDESEIEVINGDNEGIYFNSELDAQGKPKLAGQPFVPDQESIPLDGDIPLSNSSPEPEISSQEPNEDEDNTNSIPLV